VGFFKSKYSKLEIQKMKLQLKNVRLAFPQIFTPGSFDGGDKAFSAAFIFPPDHPAKKVLDDACEAVAKEKWGAKWEPIYKALVKGDKLAIHDGDTKAQYEGYEGNFFVNARNKVKPTIRDIDGRTELIEADGKPYGGCYVVAHIELYAQDNAFGKRINASLRGVQFYKDGDAFAGGTPAGDDEFESLAVDDDDLV
jgi:hypothetical protein